MAVIFDQFGCGGTAAGLAERVLQSVVKRENVA
jgi:hypothetical protein